jgi:hypothetical protein
MLGGATPELLAVANRLLLGAGRLKPGPKLRLRPLNVSRRPDCARARSALSSGRPGRVVSRSAGGGSSGEPSESDEPGERPRHPGLDVALGLGGAAR